MRAAKAMSSLRIVCADSPEPSLLAYAIEPKSRVLAHRGIHYFSQMQER